MYSVQMRIEILITLESQVNKILMVNKIIIVN